MSVRTATQADAQSIRDIYAPFCLISSAVSFELEPPTVEDIAERVRKTLETHPWLVYEEEDAVVGYAYASVHRTRAAYDWCVEVSVYLAESARGKGIGTTLYEHLFEILIDLGYINAYAGITLPNEASLALHKSLGFLEVGTYKNVGFKGGKWHDVIWLCLDLQSHSDSPQRPAKFVE